MAEWVFYNKPSKKILKSTSGNTIKNQQVETDPIPQTNKLSIQLTSKSKKLSELRTDNYKFYTLDKIVNNKDRSLQREKYGSRLGFSRNNRCNSTLEYSVNRKSKNNLNSLSNKYYK